MFPCPVCKEEILFSSHLDVSSHIRLHITQGTSFHFPLVCVKANCGAICSSLKTFAQHVKHQHAIDFVNDSQLLDTPILFDEANDFPTSFSNNLNLDTNNQSLSRVCTLIDYESLVDEILLKLLKPLNIPHTFIEIVVKSFESYVAAIQQNLLLLQTNYGSDQGVLSSREEGGIDLKERVRLDISKAVQALSEVNTVYKFQNKLYKNTRFVAPESVLLGSRWESSLSDGVVACNKRVPEESFYIPILKTLNCLLENPLFVEQIIEENFDPSPTGIYRSFKDGLTFKSHPLFSDRQKISLRLQIFYDGMGTTNPLRGHSVNHNVGIFYFTLDNLDPHSQTNSANIFLFAMSYSSDIKKYGFEPVLYNMMEDLKTLESTGIVVNVHERGDVRFFGSISLFAGDCLALNEIFGFICSFSHGYHCSMCYAQTMTESFLEKDFQLRTERSHADDVKKVLEEGILHSRGVKSDSILNSSLFFNVIRNKSLDIMHLYLEGSLPYEIGCILFELINVRNLFTIGEFNKRVRGLFTVLNIDKGNTPAELNPLKKLGGGISPKLTAVEMACLARYLPIILYDLCSGEDDELDEIWEFLTQIQILTDYAFAPKLSDSMLDYFSELQDDHLRLFLKIWPSLRIKPKQHYGVHFKTMVKYSGPPTFSSCLKYELHNNVLKRPTNTICNFKNIPKSLCYRNQTSFLSLCLAGKNLRAYSVAISRMTKVRVQTLPKVVEDRLLVHSRELIETSKKALILSQQYSKGNLVPIGKRDGLIQFACILSIIWKEKKAFLLVKKVQTLGFRSDLNAFLIEPHPPTNETNSFQLLSVEELLDFHPLDAVIPFKDYKVYVRLRYHLF